MTIQCANPAQQVGDINTGPAARFGHFGHDPGETRHPYGWLVEGASSVVLHLLVEIGRAIFELIALVLVVVWWGSSGRQDIKGQQWCASRRLDRRDRVFLTGTALMFAFSFGTFYSPNESYLGSECNTYDSRGAGVTDAPGALCRDVYTAVWRRDAWDHFANWCPIVLQILIAGVVGLRLSGWCPPGLARPITRVVMFFASLVAVISIFSDPYVKFDVRDWALWAVTFLTTVNTIAVMRSQGWAVRWMTD